jgi:ABC-type multidrug transport system ATPase subunit
MSVSNIASTNRTSAISTRGLVKNFGSTRALDGLDLSVLTGEVHGFLGPNGAGKTTTMRILLGMLRASGGTVTLLGGCHRSPTAHRPPPRQSHPDRSWP